MGYMPGNNLGHLTSLICDAIVSPTNGFMTFLSWLGNTFLQLIVGLWEIIVRIIMVVINFVLVFIDFIFVFIRQIIGINTDFSDLDKLQETDLVFKFLLTDSVTRTLRYILILSIVLIILLAIIGIIKNEYVAATTGANNSKKTVMVSTLKSLLMIVLVPMVFMGGIIMSNALLKTLDDITSGGESFSMGNQVFIASAFQANAYRRYAIEENKIPITYNFGSVDESEFFNHATEGTVAELESAFKAFTEKSGWDRGFTTYIMFYNKEFLNIDYVEKADDVAFAAGQSMGSAYHAAYDYGIVTRKAEYFIMADVVDYALENDIEIFFKTPQDVYDSWDNKSTENITESPTLDITKHFKINPATATEDENIEFKINFSDRMESVTYKSYTSYSGVQDEARGQVFLACTRDEGNHFVPLIDGYNFSTSYSVGQNLVIARGIFDDCNPTAIREEGNTIMCYRDKLNIPFIMDILPKISYEKPQGGTTSLDDSWIMKGLTGGFKALTGVDIHEFIPYVYFNFDIMRLFNKSYRTVTSFDDGGFRLNYLFNDKGVAMSHFYNYKDVNIIVLVFVSCLILGILFKALFGALARIFDIVLLYITYPAVCATIPIDNGTRFSTWVKQTINSILSIYGVVIGINMVLIIYPIIDGIQIFDDGDFQKLVALNWIPGDWTAGFVNFIFEFIMMFAAFALFKTAITMVSQIIDPDYKSKGPSDLLNRGDETMKYAKKIIKDTGDFVSGKKLVDGAKKLKEDVVGFIPGSAVVKEIADKRKFNKGQAEMANSRNDLKAAVDNKNAPQIAAQTKRVEHTTKNNTIK